MSGSDTYSSKISDDHTFYVEVMINNLSINVKEEIENPTSANSFY